MTTQPVTHCHPHIFLRYTLAHLIIPSPHVHSQKIVNIDFGSHFPLCPPLLDLLNISTDPNWPILPNPVARTHIFSLLHTNVTLGSSLVILFPTLSQQLFLTQLFRRRNPLGLYLLVYYFNHNVSFWYTGILSVVGGIILSVRRSRAGRLEP